MADNRYAVLREAASVPNNNVFTPYRGIKTLCTRLCRQGLLQCAGFSVMHGDVYIITPAGRAALATREQE